MGKNKTARQKEAGDKDGARELQARIRTKESKLIEYCDKEGLSYRRDRTEVYGYKDASRKVVPPKIVGGVDKTAESSIIKAGSDIRAVKTESNKESDAIRLRINFFDKNDTLYLDAMSIEEEDGFEDICSHGSPKAIERIVDGKKVYLSAKEFADYIKGNPGYKGKNLRIAACSAGEGDNSFAQQLSKELDVLIKAPDDDVYYIPSEGILYVGSPYTNTGKWRVFKNGDEIL